MRYPDLLVFRLLLNGIFSTSQWCVSGTNSDRRWPSELITQKVSTMHRPKRAPNNFYEAQHNSDVVYDEVAHAYSNPANELGISSLDVAAFTVNSSVYKNPGRHRNENAREGRFESMDYMDAIGKQSLKSSRRMRWLVVLNGLLSVLTLLCLGLTSFVCYKVIIKGDTCGTCDDLHATGYPPTVMANVDLTSLITKVRLSLQDLQRNVSTLELLINLERKLLHSTLSKISENVTELRHEVNRTRQIVVDEEQAIHALNLSTLKPRDLSELWRKVNSTQKDIRDVKVKLVNMSKTAPPRGPPGYNGTHGPPGRRGPSGQPGPPGPGNNITLCGYKTKSASAPGDPYATTEITVTEQQGTRIVAVHCDTNDAKVCQLSSTNFDSLTNRRKYKCQCEGSLSSGAATMKCHIHFWECRINT